MHPGPLFYSLEYLQLGGFSHSCHRLLEVGVNRRGTPAPSPSLPGRDASTIPDHLRNKD